MKIGNYCLLLFLSIIVSALIACDKKSNSQAKRLNDTIEVLKKKWDFKPLNQSDAYAFLNQYYLPGLDKTPTKRTIYIHSLAGVNFKKRFEQVSSKLKAGFALDKIVPNIEPYQTICDTNFNWDSKRLVNTIVVTGTLKKQSHNNNYLTA